MPTSSTSVCYVYGIVPATLDPVSAPDGLDDVRVATEAFDGIAALVSPVDAATYAPDALERSTADIDWMSPRAVAHDRVLTWASDRGAVVPMPMFTLFTGPDAVRSMLHERSVQLAAALHRVAQGREYALRMYRVDAELMDAMPELSPRLAELMSAAAAATPGQRYLLERKLDGEKRDEMRLITRTVIDSIVSELSAHAADAVRSPIPKVSDGAAGRGTMVLNAAFLVASDRMTGFQQTLTSLIERHGTRGFRFDFTGPWPPYHFAGADAAPA